MVTRQRNPYLPVAVASLSASKREELREELIMQVCEIEESKWENRHETFRLEVAQNTATMLQLLNEAIDSL